MSKPVYAIVLVLALVMAYAASHAQSTAQDPQTNGPKQQQPAPGQITPPITSATPSNQVGSGSQTSAGTAPSSQTPTPSEVQMPQETPAASNADLQTQIQTAMQKEPTLANDSVNVSVSDDTITLAGTVANNREKQTAMRIAQSYAINKKVVSHLTVSGHANSEGKPGGNPDRVSNPQTANPATNPEPNKGKPETGRPPQ